MLSCSRLSLGCVSFVLTFWHSCGTASQRLSLYLRCSLALTSPLCHTSPSWHSVCYLAPNSKVHFWIQVSLSTPLNDWRRFPDRTHWILLEMSLRSPKYSHLASSILIICFPHQFNSNAIPTFDCAIYRKLLWCRRALERLQRWQWRTYSRPFLEFDRRSSQHPLERQVGFAHRHLHCYFLLL